MATVANDRTGPATGTRKFTQVSNICGRDPGIWETSAALPGKLIRKRIQ